VKKIFQIVESVSFESGGLRTAVTNIDDNINQYGDFSSVILTNGMEENDPYFSFPSETFKFWNYSPDLKRHLNLNLKNVDLFHLHGVFMHAQYVSSKLALKHKIPYLISAHGMLQPWYLNDKKLKKQFYLNVLLNKILAKADIIHAITPLEKENLYKLTKHKNIVEIPNFIHYKWVPENLTYKPEEDYLLFLSRLHPGKGLDILIKAMSRIDDKKIKLKIVGTQNAYSQNLKKLCREAGLENRIEFLGSVYGSEKF